jgi:predicted RNA-binding Zn-ribbon protein involved in translation (DUF1610 family)
MFDNIGEKLKNLAKVIFFIEAIITVIIGLVYMGTDEDFVFLGLIFIIVGPLTALISSWFLYAFGQLVDDIHALRNHKCPESDNEIALEEAEAVTATRKFGCPNCGAMVKYGDPTCDKCGQPFDWSDI